MKKYVYGTLGALSLGLLLMAPGSGEAQALPAGFAVSGMHQQGVAADGLVQTVRYGRGGRGWGGGGRAWRHGGWGHGGGWGRHHRRGWGYYGPGPVIGLGLGLGAAALAAPYYAPYAPPPPVRAGLRPWSPEWYRYCSQRYRSFNPNTGYFTAYSGQQIFCR